MLRMLDTRHDLSLCSLAARQLVCDHDPRYRVAGQAEGHSEGGISCYLALHGSKLTNDRGWWRADLASPNGLRKLASARLIMSGAGWRHMHERAIETTLGRLLQTMVVPLP